MKKSFIDRIFPASPRPLLPQHEQTEPLARRPSRSPASPPRIRLQDSAPLSVSDLRREGSPLQSRSETSAGLEVEHKLLQTTPLSASVLHHDDPFLPVERAARALQDTIQSLLDVQSRALNSRINGVEQEDGNSAGSLTPTQSIVTPRSGMKMRTVPIRQPVKKKIGLRGARKGLVKKMHEFADLREEELLILETQTRARISALDRVKDLEARKAACNAEIESIRREDTTTTVSKLRDEARMVNNEIEELEHRLLELRVRHRHLMNQADQIESSQESKISSFEGTISMIDRETRDFLRRPPVPQALSDGTDQQQLGMYALKPDRRTLDMAKEQWTSEQELLVQRKVEVESEHVALLEGERIWSQAVQRINEFEHTLRVQTARLADRPGENLDTSMQAVLRELDGLIETLESDLALAESKDWNLLICVIGAELEASHQAREMLEQTRQTADGTVATVPKHDSQYTDTQLLEDGRIWHNSSSPNGSIGSNQSLKDTLAQFSDEPNSNTVKITSSTTRYESEDDEPPADFLLSR